MSTKRNKKEDPQKPAATKEIDKLLIIFFVVTVCATLYMVGKWVTTPAMPEVNLEEYWGPSHLDGIYDSTITPNQIEFSDEVVNDLKSRLLNRRRVPEPLINSGFTYGFNSNFLTRVCNYWMTSYRFKKREKYLNKFKHFTTTLNGLTVHFIHVKPKMDENITYNVVPLLMLHGWPGSVREFYELIPKLTKPGSKNFVFEIIAPSLPGFGFSEAPTRSGFGPMEMAIVIWNLMQRLGYNQYYVQGGGLGHTVGSIMATLFPDNILGFHTNFPSVVFNPTASIIRIILGPLMPGWSEEPELLTKLYSFEEYVANVFEETAFLHMQATKPDTIGAALSDSPSGLAAYILEKFSIWTNLENKKAYDGNLLKKFTLNNLLDNIMIYWITNSITTSMRIYAEMINKRQIPMIFDRIPTNVPTWGIKFRHELIHHSDRLLQLKYKNYIQSSIANDGGHFAALENPILMANDIFEAVHTFRQLHDTSKIQAQSTVYDFTVNDIHGDPVSLQIYKGYMLLFANVATQCERSDTTYRDLGEIHRKFNHRGLRILAFACNQLNTQMVKVPSTSEDIIKIAKAIGVKFDLFENVDVDGENAAPLWKFLKRMQGGVLGDKFLVDRYGMPVQRFGTKVTPKSIESRLNLYFRS